MDALLAWLLKDTVRGYMDWIGLFLSLVGIGFTIVQATGAKSAAKAASVAVRNLENRAQIANLTYASSHIETVRLLVEKGDHSAAAIVFSMVKRHIAHAHNGHFDESQIQLLEKNARVVRKQISFAIENDEKYRPALFRQALDGLGDLVTSVEANTIYQRTTEAEENA